MQVVQVDEGLNWVGPVGESATLAMIQMMQSLRMWETIQT